MTLTEGDLARFLLDVSLLLLLAHAVGAIFARWRQPRVIGEILGGLLLGPTVLGSIAPGAQADLFPSDGSTASALGAIYQLGLIWLMFAVGSELRKLPLGRERRTAVAIALSGMALPFAAGLGAFALLQPTDLIGPADDTAALALVFATALAVTSIPVISRIMMDLGLLHTPLARIVLGAAVIEDIVLFGVLGIAVGIAGSSGQDFGLGAEIGIDSGSLAGALYYAVAVGGTLAAAVTLGRWRTRPSSLLNRVCEDTALALLLVFAIVIACLLLGVPPLFGGFVAGLIAGGEKPSQATRTLREYGAAFFVPIYFAMVGFRLDLNVLEPVFFASFFLFGCAIKAGSVYLGARLSGQAPRRSRDLAVAMNARGGPGIVLAAAALDAGIIDNGFYASLVMLAVLSSLAAGWWLERSVNPESGTAGRAPEESPRLVKPAVGASRL